MLEVTDALLERLMEGTPLSGETLSRELGVTRAAVWKQIEQLRAMGFDIVSMGRAGYRLEGCPDTLMAPVVRCGLQTEWAGCEIRYLPAVDSTNRVAREAAAAGAPHGLVVLADRQTAGRGRRGRGWETPAGEAIALSIVLRPQEHPSRVSLLSLSVALAAATAVERVGNVPAMVKWPNDVVVGGRKMAGILLEMDADEQAVHSVVAGIGMNIHQKAFPQELAATAISLELAGGAPVTRAQVVRAFLAALEETERLRRAGTLLEAYRGRSATLGQRVQVVGVNERYTGTALDVTEQGSLLVRDGEGTVREVLAGDVSVRGLMGYA